MSSTNSYPHTSPVLADIPVRDLLLQKSTPIISIEPHDSVYAAIELMARSSVGAVLVIHQGVLSGILSERDYARKVILAGKSSQTTSVDSIMTRNVITVQPTTSVQTCMQLMTTNRIRHLPVTEHGQVVGLVSIGDVVRETLAQQNHAIDELHRYVWGEPRLSVQRPL